MVDRPSLPQCPGEDALEPWDIFGREHHRHALMDFNLVGETQRFIGSLEELESEKLFVVPVSNSVGMLQLAHVENRKRDLVYTQNGLCIST